MEIRHNLTNFKNPAYIYHRQADGIHAYIVGEVNNWDEVEHCIIQALYTKDNSYFLKIKDQEINLLDEDIFNKVDAIYPNQIRYAMLTYNIITNLRNGILDKSDLQKYNQSFGTRFETNEI